MCVYVCSSQGISQTAHNPERQGIARKLAPLMAAPLMIPSTYANANGVKSEFLALACEGPLLPAEVGVGGGAGRLSLS